MPRVKLHVKRYLIIPAPAGVELLARIPDPVNQIGLHKAVNVLIFVCDFQCPIENIV